MTEKEITTKIARLAQRRLDIYAELQDMSPFSNRDALCRELRDCELHGQKLYAELRWIRAGGWNPGTQHKPSRTAILSSIRGQRRARLSVIRGGSGGMSGKYAARTTVSSDRSRGEIERVLRRYGADQFAYGWDQQHAMIGFRVHSRNIRFRLPLPDPDDDRFWLTPTGKDRNADAAEREYEQAVRQRWRALLLVIKAKLEAVEAGIVTFEDEFLAHTLLPDGQTVGESIHPMIEHAYQTGQVPALLPGIRQLGDGQ